MTPDSSIEQLNKTLEEKLAELKKATDPNAAGQLTNELDAILYSAIAEHPVEVDAVEIKLKADVSNDHFAKLTYPNTRGFLRLYLQLLQQTAILPTGVADLIFIEHLSYNRNVRLSNIYPIHYPKFNHQNQLMIDLGSGYDREILIDVLSSEIASIRLVDAEKTGGFRPFLSNIPNLKLKPSPSALEHYLYYLGFTGYPDSLLLPDPSLKLLSADHMLVHGYAAVKQDNGEVVLYQFRSIHPVLSDNFQIPVEMTTQKRSRQTYNPIRDYEYVANRLLLHIIDQEAKIYGDNITKYRGKDAIERLFQASKEKMICREIKAF